MSKKKNEVVTMESIVERQRLKIDDLNKKIDHKLDRLQELLYLLRRRSQRDDLEIYDCTIVEFYKEILKMAEVTKELLEIMEPDARRLPNAIQD